MGDNLNANGELGVFTVHEDVQKNGGGGKAAEGTLSNDVGGEVPMPVDTAPASAIGSRDLVHDADNLMVEKEFEIELNNVKQDVKHLKSGLSSVSQRVERLEFARAASIEKRTRFVEMSNDTQHGASGDRMDVDGVPSGHQWSHEIRTPPSPNSEEIRRIVKSTSYHRAFGQGTEGAMPPGLNYMEDFPSESYRVVGVRRPKGHEETMGLSFSETRGTFFISAIQENSLIAKSGLLHVGDTVLAINDVRVTSLQQAMEQLIAFNEGFQMKVVPAQPSLIPASVMHVKAYFGYNPSEDKMIPLKTIGLPFRAGDILQVISKDDDNWWQARKIFGSSQIGIIPSQHFQLTRTPVKAATSGRLSLLKKSKEANGVISPGKGSEKGMEPQLIYEEIGRLCPYGRKVLILIGAPGVGRRTLKSRLLRHDPLHFATVVPYTSRPRREGEIDGREYHFISKEKMKKDVENEEFVEWGEFNGNYYGTRLQSVKDIIRTGKMCVLDCSPQATGLLYNWEFMPYVVFVTPPPLDELKALYASQNHFRPKTEEELAETTEQSAKLDANFKHYFDLILTNRNAEVTFRRLLDSLETLKTQQQWVPTKWLTD